MDRNNHIATTAFVTAITGLEAMFACFLLFGVSAPRMEVVRSLTGVGAALYKPERELPIYALGLAITVAAAVIACGRRKRTAIETDGIREAWLCTLSAVGAVAFLLVCLLMPRQIDASTPLPAICAILISAALLAVWFFVARASRIAIPDWFESLFRDAEKLLRVPATPRRIIRIHAAELAIPALIIGLVFIPNGASLAGFDFSIEKLHHWDFFLVGPALGYLRGGSLGNTVYAQYGVGFPVVAATIAKWAPLNYATLIRLALVVACGYYAALYGLLRALLRTRGWALFALLIAIDFQLFHGVDAHSVLWQFPSSTVMRSPFDVFILAALLWDSRSESRIALAVASLLCGLAILFETDTGIYLAVTVAGYAAFTRSPAGRLDWRAILQSLPELVVPGGLTLLTGLEIAARGTALTQNFASGWLEVFRLYPSGIGMLPINMSAEGVAVAFLVIALYLSVVCRYAAAWRAGRSSPAEALPAAIALYGLAYLCQYIGRSHPFNLYHSSIPAIILVAMGLRDFVGRLVASQGGAVAIARRREFVITLGLAGAACLHIVAQRGFQDYPNLLHPNWEAGTVRANGPEFGSAGVRVPVSQPDAAIGFVIVTEDARRMARAGHTVFFLVNNDPIYYMASGARSQFRYSPLFQCLLTRDLDAAFERQFIQDRIDYVYAPMADPTRPDIEAAGDVRDSLKRIVRSRYRLDHRCGGFEVWRRL